MAEVEPRTVLAEDGRKGVVPGSNCTIMDFHSSSGEPKDDPVTTVQAGEEAVINNEISREDVLIEKLEEMYLKLHESGSQRRDTWEGEDAEYYNVKLKKSEKLAKKKMSKSELAVNNSEQAGTPGEVIVKTKEKRYSFKQADRQKRIKEGKEKTEEEIKRMEQIKNYALQIGEKTRRRRKRGFKSEHKVKSNQSVEDGFNYKTNARVEELDVQLVRSNPVWTFGRFTINKEREHASWRSAITLIAPKDIQSLLFGNSTTFVGIAKAWLESYPRFQRFAVVVTYYKQPDSNFGISSLANCGILQAYTSAKETIFAQLPSNAAKSAYQDITELMEGRALLRPGNMKVPFGTENPKNDVRKQAMRAVHAQLLEKVIEMKSNMKARREKMAAIHDELKRLVFKKGLGMNEDEDACFVPRRLFLFDIKEFREVPRVEVTAHVSRNIPYIPQTYEDMPSCSNEPLADLVEEKETTVKKTKTSLGGRLLKFLGFR
eukprot:XP_019929775.1 PREDICTED: uncharacterized protein LOC105345638 [Crassostrea gigas]